MPTTYSKQALAPLQVHEGRHDMKALAHTALLNSADRVAVDRLFSNGDTTIYIRVVEDALALGGYEAPTEEEVKSARDAFTKAFVEEPQEAQ